MADPVSLLTLGASVFKAVGAIQSAKAERDAANYNAAIADRNADITQQQTDAAMAQQRKAAAKAMGGMRAAYAASGVTFEGSPLDVLEASASEAELDRQNIEYQGTLKKQGYQMEASLERARGKNVMRAGYISATATLLGGGADFFKPQGTLTRV
jgi:hypothetical protein